MAVENSRGFRLSTHDRQILEHIARNRFATIIDLYYRLYKGKDMNNLRAKLRRLARAGLLDSLQGDGGIRLGYRLTRKGVKQINSEEIRLQAKYAMGASYRTNYEHDRKIQQIRGLLEASPLVSHFHSEHVVRPELAKKHGGREEKDGGYKVPDAIFHLRTVRRTLIAALEVELTAKSSKRYRKVFRNLSISDDFNVVLFVAGDEAISNKLKRLLIEAREKDPAIRALSSRRGFYFARLDEVLTKGLDATFEGDGNPFSLRELEREFPPDEITRHG